MIEKLTVRQRVLLVSPQLPSDEHIVAGVTALNVIDAQESALAAIAALMPPRGFGMSDSSLTRIREALESVKP